MKRLSLSFDPNSCIADNAGLFGHSISLDQANLVIQEVPWEVTTSYGRGTALGPAAILRASHQLDYYHPEIKRPYEYGIHLAAFPQELKGLHQGVAAQAIKIIEAHEAGSHPDNNLLDNVNAACQKVNDYVFAFTKDLISRNKIPAILGGDHATPLGAIKALSQHYPDMGILHIDAHADLRIAYEGFTYSHASIMYNVLKESKVAKIVQVGIRDYCEEEVLVMREHNERIRTFYDRDLEDSRAQGINWNQQCQHILAALPRSVYISFDIDGLDPSLCPHTGTPVPGGLSYQQAVFLLRMVCAAGKNIVGFDLCEVGHQPWDANVGARMLYELCAQTLISRELK